MKLFHILILLLLAASWTFGQGKITGQVIDRETEKPVQGAKLKLTNHPAKTTSDKNGQFEFKEIPEGFHEINISHPDYETDFYYADVVKHTNIGALPLKKEFKQTEIQNLANASIEKKSPVSYTGLTPGNISTSLGNRDLPMAFQHISAVYVSENGGGAGDSKIRIRGFDQQNINLSFNGIPLNDMEDNSTHWYHWEGLTDAASGIQLQKGLSSTPFAFPSAGGTINITAHPADEKSGGFAQFEYGTANLLKASFKVNSGLIRNRFGLSFGMTKKNGDGIMDYTWNDALSLFGGGQLILNKNHKIEFFGFAAPQRHGVNHYRQNIGAYSQDMAERTGTYDEKALSVWLPELAQRTWNQAGSPVSGSYNGKQYFLGREKDRYASGFINERESYSQKPLFSLNYYANFSPRVSALTTFYGINGETGLTGSSGIMQWNTIRPSRVIDYDKTIAANKLTGISAGILHNSVNQQNTFGLLTKVNYKIGKHFSSNFGLDARTAKIEKYDEVRDLLGGNTFSDNNDAFNPNRQTGLGDKINYHQTKNIDRLGLFAQLNYDRKGLHAFFTAGLNGVQYTLTDHFKKIPAGEVLSVKADIKPGFHLKTGALYNLNQEMSTFINLAYVSQVPAFDFMIQPTSGTTVTDPQNERFQHVELGAMYDWEAQKLSAKISGYFTNWQNRSKIQAFVDSLGNSGFLFASGISQRHLGFELDAVYEPIPLVEVNASLSFGAWVYNEDTEGTYKDYSTGEEKEISYGYYLGKLKTGGTPQTQAFLGIAVKPLKGLRADIGVRYFTEFFADYDPFIRTNKTDIAQAWRTPGAAVLDARILYNLPRLSVFDIQIFGQVFNILNTNYVSDASDNSLQQAYRLSGTIVNTHAADAAEVYLGLPFRFNIGARVNF